MRLSLMRMMLAAAFAAPAIAVSSPSGGPARADARAGPAPTQHLVDLNSASRKELMTLPGIGTAEAGRIVANRPYLTKTDLVAKNVMPVGPYVSLKHLVVALPATVAKGKH
jgi:competence protein ComEA